MAVCTVNIVRIYRHNSHAYYAYDAYLDGYPGVLPFHDGVVAKFHVDATCALF